MTEITLSKTETNLLVEAAGRGGALHIPEITKPGTRQRLLGRFAWDGLIRSQADGHELTPAGYRAVGLRPPRQKRAESEAAPDSAISAGPVRPGTKLALVQGLLRRGEGASIGELIAATGWLPHTTRAVLSRLRSAGKELVKSTREDGTTAYRIAAEEPAAPKRRSRSRQAEGAEPAALA